MYSTCLFCNQPLGANEALEAFPVGRRLAYDAARGRLWVVCRQCERWNLTPLEERWEAIEQAERAYGATRLRVATDHVGLARLRDGTELVRIGQPQRPELAAWRYGDQFGRRRRKRMLVAGAAAAGIGAVVVGGAWLGVGVAGFWQVLYHGARGLSGRNPNADVASLPTGTGSEYVVKRLHLDGCRVGYAGDGALMLRLAHSKGYAQLNGARAEAAAARLLAAANAFGGSSRQVQDAVARLERAGTAVDYVRSLPSLSLDDQPQDARARLSRWWGNADAPAFGVNATQRLALEMALHEEQERRALEGELAALELAWREAEEIAGIADSLLVGDAVEAKLARLRRDA